MIKSYKNGNPKLQQFSVDINTHEERIKKENDEKNLVKTVQTPETCDEEICFACQ